MLSLYIAKQTWLHRVPAPLKLLGLASCSVAALWAANLWLNLLLLSLASLGFLSLGSAGRWRLRRLVTGLMPFLVVLFLAQLLLHWTAGSLGIEDLQRSGTTLTQLLSLVVIADLVTATTTISQMLEVFKSGLSPLRLFGFKDSLLETTALAVGLMIRMVGLLAREWDEVRAAFTARGRARPGIAIIPALMRRQLMRAQRIEEALLARRSNRPEANPPAEAISARPS